jgi:hypothetical protein
MNRLLLSMAWAITQIWPFLFVLNFYFDPTDGAFWWLLASALWLGLASQWEERLRPPHPRPDTRRPQQTQETTID